METKKLVEKLMASAAQVPPRAEVLSVRQHPMDELERRMRRFLAALNDVNKQPMKHGDWMSHNGRTVIHMPLGACAVLYHASGAMSLHTGLKPMEALFRDREQNEAALLRMVEHAATEARVRDWISPDTVLRFEKLWYIKACAAAREKEPIKPVLCRVVGAYRHIVGELPVLGPASMALKVAGEGKLESVSFLLREATGEVIDRPEILPPEHAARQISLELRRLMGKSNIDLDEAAVPRWFRFGYLSLPKRKPQRVLAPAYIAAISIQGQQEAQGYIFCMPATEAAYLPLGLVGTEAPPTRVRQSGEEVIAEAQRAVA